jgi:thiol:disulfide interchange protein DsbD
MHVTCPGGRSVEEQSEMRALLLLAFLVVATSSAADPEADAPLGPQPAAPEDGSAHVDGRLLVHPERDEDGRMRAGVLLTLDPGWTVAWRHPGEAGLATKVRWQGAEAGPVEWPAPEAFRDASAPLTRFGYAGEVLLTSELLPHDGVTRIEVEVEALVCRAACIPARLSLSRAIDHVEPPEIAASVRRLFARHAEELPKPPEAFGLEPRLEDLGGGRLALTLAPCDERAACRSLAAPRFAPSLAGFRVLDTSDAEGEIVILIERERAAPRQLGGVLSLTTGDGRTSHLEIELTPGVRASVASGFRVGALLCLAFVIGLVARATPSRAAQLEEALPARAGLGAYGAGVLAIVLLWTGLVASTRAVVHAVGGPTGSDASVVAVLAALLCTVSALNGLGVFELPAAAPPAEADVKPRGAFARGLSAPLRAWRCLLPVLVPALALSPFVAPHLAVTSAFALGLGAALPPLLLVSHPRAREWFPPPIPLGSELRWALGLLPLAAVVWLVVGVARSGGPEAAGALLAALLTLALTVRGFTRWGGPGLRGGSLAVGLCLIAIAGARVVAPAAAPDAPEPGVWNAETFERLRAMHRPVLVVFTADWCIPCRWNEQAVVASAPVRAALVSRGYSVLRADWTDQNETIRRELARFGRAGVPLTLAYRRGADEPERLPDVLTVDAVLAALDGTDLAARDEPDS